MKKIYFLLFICAVKFSWAENSVSITPKEFLDEMKNISIHLKKSSSFSTDVTYISYEMEKSEIIHDQNFGYIKGSKSNFHTYAFGLHTIQNENERIVVDSINKIISVTNPINNELQNYTPEMTEEVLKKAKSIHRISENGMQTYDVVFGMQFIISSYKIIVDKELAIRQLDIVYNKKTKGRSGVDVNMRMKVLFNNWKFNTPIPQNEFSMEKYVQFKNKKYIPTSMYKPYLVYDQRLNN